MMDLPFFKVGDVVYDIVGDFGDIIEVLPGGHLVIQFDPVKHPLPVILYFEDRLRCPQILRHASRMVLANLAN